MERGNRGEKFNTVAVNVTDPYFEEKILDYTTTPSQIQQKLDLGESQDSYN